jgi:hypothetical protein
MKREVVIGLSSAVQCCKFGANFLLKFSVASLFAMFISATTVSAQSDETIEGLRTAAFGMDKDAVLAAIETDFGITEDGISASRHSVERTELLTISVDDLIPDSGPAAITYIFGFESKTLIQVNLVWGAPTNAGADPAQLVATSEILKSFFLSKGFPSEKVLTDIAITDEVLVVYQGTDVQDRSVLMTLTAPATGEISEAGTPIFDTSQLSLTLSYISDATNPDVFTLPPDAF